MLAFIKTNVDFGEQITSDILLSSNWLACSWHAVAAAQTSQASAAALVASAFLDDNTVDAEAQH